MDLVYAMTLRDGGTTFVVIEDPALGQVTYTFDYKLPWDGRTRMITAQHADGPSHALLPNSPQELSICEQVKSLLSAQFGEQPVNGFLLGRVDNPGKDKWFYAFNFLRLAVKEGKFSA